MVGAADDMRERIERWFTRQGLPLFVTQGYGARRSPRRAIQVFVALWMVEFVFLVPNRGYRLAFDVLVMAAGLAILLGAGGLGDFLSMRLSPPVGPGFGIAIFVVAPALVPVIFGRQLLSAIATAAMNLVVVVLLGLLISGLFHLTVWAIHETWRQTFQLLTLLAGALPVLIVAVMILFLTSEVWQMAANVHGPFLLIIAALFIVLGTLCLLRGLASEVKKRCDESAEDRIKRFCEHLKTAAKDASLKGLEDLDIKNAPPRSASPPTRLQRVNIGLVLLFSMSLQIVAVSVAVGVMILIFGMLAIPTATAKGFLGGHTSRLSPVPHVLSGTLWGQPIVLTRELGYVTAFIALFSYLSFVFYVVTNEGYIEKFLDQVDKGVHAALVVREIYLTRIWEPRLHPIDRGRRYRLSFELPAAFRATEATLHGRTDKEWLPRYSMDGQSDGRFSGELILPAGTCLRYHYDYVIDPQNRVGCNGDGQIADDSGVEELVLQLPARTAKARTPAGAGAS